MSIQQCYENFTSHSLLLNDYKIFKSLVNYGFIVKKSSTNSKPSDSIDVTSKTLCLDARKEPKTNESIIKKADHGQLTKKEVFQKLDDFIPSIALSDIRNMLASRQPRSDQSKTASSNKFRPAYDVYLPNKNFKRSQPGSPIFKISTQGKSTASSSGDQLYLPKLIDLLVNEHEAKTQHPASKVFYGFVNNTDTIYYSFNADFDMPKV